MKKNKGFTLIELLIVVAVIGILAATATSSFRGYVQSAQAAQGMQALTAYKTGVGICHQRGGNLTRCDHGVDEVPEQVMDDTINGLKFVTVTDGVITAALDVPNTVNPVTGVVGEVIVVSLIPDIQPAAINWTISCSDFDTVTKETHVEGCTESFQMTP